MRNPFKRNANRQERRIISKGVLTDVDVELISLLFDDMQPANKKGYVAKSEGKSFKNIGSSAKMKIEKSETEGRIYVTIMEPNVKDSEGDMYTSEEVLKACESFAKKGLIRKNDVNHNMQPADEFYISQSYVLKAEDKEHFPETALGSWVGVIKCDNLASELWKKVDDGKFNGVSIFGSAVDQGEAKLEEMKAAITEIQKSIKEIAAKSGDEQTDQVKKLMQQVEGLQTSLEAEAGEESKELLKAIKDLAVELKKGINVQIKGEPDGGRGMEEDRTYTLPNGEKLVVKAEKRKLYKALADIYAGNKLGMLTANETKGFLDAIIGMGGDILSDFSLLPLTKAGTVDTGLLTDMILYNSADNVVSQNVSTGALTMGPQVLQSTTVLAAATCEYYKDALGSDEAFGAYIEQAITVKIRKALTEIVFGGVRAANGGANISAMDGVCEKARDASAITTLTVDDKEAPVASTLFSLMLAEFDEATLLNTEGFKIYVSKLYYLELLKQYANRLTPLGDQFIMNGGKLYYNGYEIKMAKLLTDYHICAGISKMVVIGYINDVDFKIEHTGVTFAYNFYSRSNWGVNYVDGPFQVFVVSE